MNRKSIGFMAATLLPPLATLLVIKAENITDPTYWLTTLTVTIGSFASASIYTLTQLNSEAGNPPPVTNPSTSSQGVTEKV